MDGLHRRRADAGRVRGALSRPRGSPTSRSTRRTGCTNTPARRSCGRASRKPDLTDERGADSGRLPAATCARCSRRHGVQRHRPGSARDRRGHGRGSGDDRAPGRLVPGRHGRRLRARRLGGPAARVAGAARGFAHARRPRFPRLRGGRLARRLLRRSDPHGPGLRRDLDRSDFRHAGALAGSGVRLHEPHIRRLRRRRPCRPRARRLRRRARTLPRLRRPRRACASACASG